MRHRHKAGNRKVTRQPTRREITGPNGIGDTRNKTKADEGPVSPGGYDDDDGGGDDDEDAGSRE